MEQGPHASRDPTPNAGRFAFGSDDEDGSGQNNPHPSGVNNNVETDDYTLQVESELLDAKNKMKEMELQIQQLQQSLAAANSPSNPQFPPGFPGPSNTVPFLPQGGNPIPPPVIQPNPYVVASQYTQPQPQPYQNPQQFFSNQTLAAAGYRRRTQCCRWSPPMPLFLSSSTITHPQLP